MEVLKDPNAVHVNMLRGSIARPSVRQIIHIYGEEALRAEMTSQQPDLVEVLRKVDDFICDLAGDTPMMDYCRANPEAETLLLEVRAALSRADGEGS